MPPFRRDFDAARDPYTARNALGILDAGGSGGGAPDSAEYITGSADATLTNERVLTNTATVTWDLSTAGQAKANATGFGNVSNSGIITSGYLAQWNDPTHISAVPIGGLGLQPFDNTLNQLSAYNTNGLLTQTATDTFTGRTITGPAAGITVSNGSGVAGDPTLALADDLAALEALAGTNTIYYRSGTSAWTAVTIAGSMTFSGGSLAAYGGQLPGTSTNDNAATGNVGEYLTGTFSSTVNLVASTITNLMSVSNVPAGDWDAWAYALWQPASTLSCEMEITTTSASLTGIPLNGYRTSNPPAGNFCYEINHRRLSLSATTTVYLVARCGGACPVLNGFVALRRRR